MLTRITFNPNVRATAALTAITAASGDNKTYAINKQPARDFVSAVRAHGDRALRVIAPDSTTQIVHLP